MQTTAGSYLILAEPQTRRQFLLQNTTTQAHLTSFFGLESEVSKFKLSTLHPYLKFFSAYSRCIVPQYRYQS
jgi:hypothetical protein